MIDQEGQITPEEMALEVRRLAEQLMAADRKDLLLRAIGVPLLEELRIEAAKGKLSRLVITKDYRFILADYQQEVVLQPVHKAVYLLFLAHPEGIEFKRLGDYRKELTDYYMQTAKMMDKEKIMEGIEPCFGEHLESGFFKTVFNVHRESGIDLSRAFSAFDCPADSVSVGRNGAGGFDRE